MFKKIISIILVIGIVTSIVTSIFVVYADTTEKNIKQVMDEYKQQSEKLFNKEITPEQYSNEMSVLHEQLGAKPLSQAAFGTVQSMTLGLYNAGVSFSEFMDFIYYYSDKLTGKATTTTKPTIDMGGYGALCIGEGSMLAGRVEYYYCDYMKVVDNRVEFYTDGIANKCVRYYYYHATDTGLTNGPFNHTLSSRPLIPHYDTNGRLYYQYTVYGDIRYSDGTTEYKDVPTETNDVINYEDLTDNEIAALLNELIAKLNSIAPADLTTIEGLLRAIYQQCVDINSKVLTKDDLDAVIIQILDQNKDSEILEVLLELRDNMVNGSSDNNDTDTIDLLTEIRDLLDSQGETDTSSILTEIRDLLIENNNNAIELTDTNDLLQDVLDVLNKNQDKNINNIFYQILQELQSIDNKDYPVADLSEVTTLLTDIKKLLTLENEEKGSNKKILGILYNVVPFEKTFFGGLLHGQRPSVIWNDKKYYLESDGTLYLSVFDVIGTDYESGYYNVDMNYNPSTSDINNYIELGLINETEINNYFVDLSADLEATTLVDLKLSKFEKKIANTFIDILSFLNKMTVFNTFNTFAQTFTDTLFYEYTPSDITISLSFDGIFYDKDALNKNQDKSINYVLIPATILTDNKDSIDTIRALSGTLILFAWVLSFRKKTSIQ